LTRRFIIETLQAMNRYFLPAVLVVLLGCLYLQAQQQQPAAQPQIPAAEQRGQAKWEYAMLTIDGLEEGAAIRAPGVFEGSSSNPDALKEIAVFLGAKKDAPKPHLHDVLMLLGASGWELTGTVTTGSQTVYIFKRPKAS
jgi:hypothetical protein